MEVLENAKNPNNSPERKRGGWIAISFILGMFFSRFFQYLVFQGFSFYKSQHGKLVNGYELRHPQYKLWWIDWLVIENFCLQLKYFFCFRETNSI